MLEFFKHHKLLEAIFYIEVSVLFVVLGFWVLDPRGNITEQNISFTTEQTYLDAILQNNLQQQSTYTFETPQKENLEYALPDNLNAQPFVPQKYNNPLASEDLYVTENNNAKNQANEWKTTRPDDAAKMDFLAQQPTAKWIVTNQVLSVYNEVRDHINQATTGGELPVLVAYNIPGRDCNSYSAGGASTAEGYKRWIENFSNGISGNKAVVILEPDALASIDCLDNKSQEIRYTLLHHAVETLKKNARTLVYLDGGNSKWIEASVIAKRLERAGAYLADGFALNVSNFNTTQDSAIYGESVSNFIGGKHFVIDTSRNGSGPAPHFEWCNPHDRSLGPSPTTNTGNPLIDAYLWIKVPGESDGNCNGGPNAGEWWAEYALDLVKNTHIEQPVDKIQNTTVTEQTMISPILQSTATSLKAGAKPIAPNDPTNYHEIYAVSMIDYATTPNSTKAKVNDVVTLKTIVDNNTIISDGFIVDVEIYNAENVRVFQKFVENQKIPLKGSKSYRFEWIPQQPGSYSIRVGIFNKDWTHNYFWENEAHNLEVEDRGPVSYNNYASDYANKNIDIWWPADNNSIGGQQPFKALVNTLDINSYKMYWSVDNGKLNLMENNYTDYPHKEALVDLSEWNWKANNHYQVIFVAKDLMGNTFSVKTVSLIKK